MRRAVDRAGFSTRAAKVSAVQCVWVCVRACSRACMRVCLYNILHTHALYSIMHA